jgi:hypothetical protein
MDLGLHLARRDWKALYFPWLLVFLPMGIGLFVLLNDWPLLALVVFWLLKPAFDPIPLEVLSQTLFGSPPPWHRTLAALPRLMRTGLGQALPRRLSPARSFLLPIRQLEGLGGNEARQRARILQAGDRGHAVGLTILFMLLELAMLSSLLWLIPLFIPAELETGFARFVFLSGNQAGWLFWAFAVGYLFTVAFLEPFYVACGFALYLNRRTVLEAWDVEMSFRRLSRRLTSLTTLVLFVFAVMSGSVLAADSVDQSDALPRGQPPVWLPAEDARNVIEEVLAQPEFDVWEEVPAWRFRPSSDSATAWQFPDLEIGKLLAGLAEWLLWLGLLIGVLLLAKHWRRWLPFMLPVRRPQRAKPPTTLFGLDIRPESLPSDVPGAARALWVQGKKREALSLLYRGALSHLVAEKGITVPDSATENECLRLLRPRVEPGLYDHMRRLTLAWDTVAYAHRPPTEQEIDNLLDSWRVFFGANP